MDVSGWPARMLLRWHAAGAECPGKVRYIFMAETPITVQRAEERPAAIHPVKSESLAERMNKMFETVAKRAYQIFESNGLIFGHEIDDWFKAESELFHPVHVEMTESGEILEVKAEVPGF